MPWLEWTLKHFYPKYIVDRGSIEDLGAARNGLECLLQDQLGIGNGQVFDALAREITSAFTLAEQEFNKQACRELDRLKEGGTSYKDPGVQDSVQSAAEDRKHKMLARYEDEFKNKFYDYAIKEIEELSADRAGRTSIVGTTSSGTELGYTLRS